MFFTFFKLYKCYKIAQHITYVVLMIRPNMKAARLFFLIPVWLTSCLAYNVFDRTFSCNDLIFTSQSNLVIDSGIILLYIQVVTTNYHMEYARLSSKLVYRKISLKCYWSILQAFLSPLFRQNKLYHKFQRKSWIVQLVFRSSVQGNRQIQWAAFFTLCLSLS